MIMFSKKSPLCLVVTIIALFLPEGEYYTFDTVRNMCKNLCMYNNTYFSFQLSEIASFACISHSSAQDGEPAPTNTEAICYSCGFGRNVGEMR